MTPQQVINYFGSVKAVCTATGRTHQAIYHWIKVKRVPDIWQFKLAEMTGGKLKRAK